MCLSYLLGLYCLQKDPHIGWKAQLLFLSRWRLKSAFKSCQIYQNLQTVSESLTKWLCLDADELYQLEKPADELYQLVYNPEFGGNDQVLPS